MSTSPNPKPNPTNHRPTNPNHKPNPNTPNPNCNPVLWHSKPSEYWASTLHIAHCFCAAFMIAGNTAQFVNSELEKVAKTLVSDDE